MSNITREMLWRGPDQWLTLEDRDGVRAPFTVWALPDLKAVEAARQIARREGVAADKVDIVKVEGGRTTAVPANELICAWPRNRRRPYYRNRGHRYVSPYYYRVRGE